MTSKPPSTPDDEHRSDFVQSLERGLAVIKAFDADNTQLTLSEVARRTGLTRAATRRFLLTLAELGYVRSDGRLFALRPRVLELGYAYLSSLSLPEIALPHMEQLVSRVHESCSMSVLDGTDIIYVGRVPTKRIMTVNISVGSRFPAVTTSMGRVLLAHLPADELDAVLAASDLRSYTPRTVKSVRQLRKIIADVRAAGWAIVDQELEIGLRSIAAPVHDASGSVLAAVNVSFHASRATVEELEHRFVPELVATTRRIDEDLGGPGTGRVVRPPVSG